MTPYYQDDWTTIYHGDCREIIPRMDSVDSVIVDPPYGIGFREYYTHDDNPGDYEALLRDSVFEAEKLVSNGWMCVFQTAKKCREWAKMFDREWRLIACAKNFVQILPNAGPIWSCDYALVWQIGNVSTPKGKGRDWHIANTSDMRSRPKGHPCPRPIDQMCFIVETFSVCDQTILDPFMGSGTTLRAAKNLGRKAIGIEIEECYCEIAARRLQQEVFNFAPVEEPQPEQLLIECT